MDMVGRSPVAPGGALEQMDLDSGGHAEEAVGKMGRVSVPISQGVPGEVIIQIRGGSEAYTAYTESEEPLAVNTRIVVVEQLSSRTLLVTSC
jgi:hypothetical protein